MYVKDVEVVKLKGKFYISFLVSIIMLLGACSFIVFYSYGRQTHSNSLRTEIISNEIVADTNTIDLTQDDDKSITTYKNVVVPNNIEVIISSAGDCTIGSDDSFYKPSTLFLKR